MFLIFVSFQDDFSGGSVVKNPPANAGDVDSVLGSGRSPGEGNGNPLQYSCLEGPMDRGAWWATVPGVTQCLNNNNNPSRKSVRETAFTKQLPHARL